MRFVVACACLLACGLVEIRVIADERSDASATTVSRGRELFLREWIANDPRSHGGDGLGPVFNDSSCIACHNQGGEGGGGAEAKNVQVISAVRNLTQEEQKLAMEARQRRQQVPRGMLQAEREEARLAKKNANRTADPEREALLTELKELHPALAKTRSVVLHRSGTDGDYPAWKQKLLFPPQADEASEVNFEGLGNLRAFSGGGLISVTRSFRDDVTIPTEMGALMSAASTTSQVFRNQFISNGQKEPKQPRFSIQMGHRNTTALFGVGLIDSIPDTVLIEAAQKFHSGSPLVSGRVARLKDGKIGRFGWKGQKANLYDFTVTACAVELGLHVPDHPQAGLPHKPDYQPAGFDLSKDQCLEMVEYLKALPAPARAPAEHDVIRETLKSGEQLFAKVGCAACHVPKLGEVVGIFSDLLLHDMGPQNGDAGSYDSFSPGSNGSDSDDPLPNLADASGDEPDKHGLQPVPSQIIGALSLEWRTPPLWGVRDSAPYLHDGRAQSLEQAIAMHGGEAQSSAIKFFKLKPEDRQKVLAFLRSLVAPNVVALAK